MSENQVSQEQAPTAEELRQNLMTKARTLGIDFSNNISNEKLLERIKAKVEGTEDKQESFVGSVESKAQIRTRIHAENMKLVRLRITCLDPKKKDLPGEIITVANSYLGTVRKFVPYGEVTENGYHVPYCIYKMLKRRKFLNIRVTKRNGKETQEYSYVPEFALEVLPQLTQADLNRLANQQAAAAGATGNI